MNEEEKESIEYLKLKIKKDNSIIQGMFGDIYDEIRKDNKAIETLITVCDKQQKEIEDLKAITREYESYKVGEGNNIVIASKNWFVDGFFEEYLNKYISKDKIKAKIKELESHIWKDGYMTKFDRYAIHYLKELLGE